MKKIINVVAGVLVLLCPTISRATVFTGVCVGIDSYAVGDELEACTWDAEDMRNQLVQKHGWTIALITNNQATESNITNAIRNLPKTNGTNTSLFFFAGHGGYDGIVSSDYGTINPAELYHAFTDSTDSYNQYCVILDVCRAGLFTNYYKYHELGGIVSAACASSELAYDNGPDGHGVFSAYLCEVIARVDSDSAIAAENLHYYAASRANSYTLDFNYYQRNVGIMNPQIADNFPGYLNLTSGNSNIEGLDVDYWGVWEKNPSSSQDSSSYPLSNWSYEDDVDYDKWGRWVIHEKSMEKDSWGNYANFSWLYAASALAECLLNFHAGFDTTAIDISTGTKDINGDYLAINFDEEVIKDTLEELGVGWAYSSSDSSVNGLLYSAGDAHLPDVFTPLNLIRNTGVQCRAGYGDPDKTYYIARYDTLWYMYDGIGYTTGYFWVNRVISALDSSPVIAMLPMAQSYLDPVTYADFWPNGIYQRACRVGQTERWFFVHNKVDTLVYEWVTSYIAEEWDLITYEDRPTGFVRDYGTNFRAVLITGYNLHGRYWICRDFLRPGNGIVKIAFGELDSYLDTGIELFGAVVGRDFRLGYPKIVPANMTIGEALSDTLRTDQKISIRADFTLDCDVNLCSIGTGGVEFTSNDNDVTLNGYCFKYNNNDFAGNISSVSPDSFRLGNGTYTGFYPSLKSMVSHASAGDTLYLPAGGTTIAAGDTLSIPDGVVVCMPQDIWAYNYGYEEYVMSVPTKISVNGRLHVGSGAKFICLSDTAWSGIWINSTGKMKVNGPCAISDATDGVVASANSNPIENTSETNRISITDCYTGVKASSCAPHLDYFTITDCEYGVSLSSCTGGEIHNVTVTGAAQGIWCYSCSGSVSIHNVLVRGIGGWEGIYLSKSTASLYATITEATIKHFQWGIYLDSGTSSVRVDAQIGHTEIDSCLTVSTSGVGVYLSAYSNANMYSSEITHCNYCFKGASTGYIAMDYPEDPGCGYNNIVPDSTGLAGCVMYGVAGGQTMMFNYWGGTPQGAWFTPGIVDWSMWLTSPDASAGRQYPNSNKTVAAQTEEETEEAAATAAVTNAISIAPNPANPATTITYSLTKADNVKLTVYSLNGQKVATLVNGPVTAGVHSATFNGANFASGIYFYRFESAGMKKTGKFMLLK